MLKLNPPAIDDLATYDAITAAKEAPRGTLMAGCRDRVVNAYATYSAAAPHVGNLQGFVATEDESEALRHAFIGSTEPMRALRCVLATPSKTVRCPYCGIGETGPLDHYLPKERYSEYSTFSKNLVPICGNCNTYKRNLILDENKNVRLFLHPYYDEIPNDLFLTVNITILSDAMAVVFSIGRTSGMSDNALTQLRAHFHILRLGDRYTKNSVEYLKELHPSLKRDYERGGKAIVERELLHRGRDFLSTHGANHWRGVLCGKLASIPSFCDGGFSVLGSLP